MKLTDQKQEQIEKQYKVFKPECIKSNRNPVIPNQ